MSGEEAALVLDCKRAAEAMGVYVERIGQHRADKAGSDRGVPDMLVYVNERVLIVEFKRAVDRDTHTPCGRLSLDQLVAIERRDAQGVMTFVVDRLEDFVRIVNAARMARGVERAR